MRFKVGVLAASGPEVRVRCFRASFGSSFQACLTLSVNSKLYRRDVCRGLRLPL